MKIIFDKKEKIIIFSLLIVSLSSFFFDNIVIAFSNLIKNSFFDYTLSIFSNTFSLFLPLVIITSAYLYFKNKKEGIIPLWITLILTTIVVYLIKFLVHRPRIIGEMYTSFLHIPDYSFPSAHAALAFAILAIIDEEMNDVKIVWLMLAILITFSRVYFSYHYLSDVLFGALIGYLMGILVFKVWTNLKARYI